MGVPITGSLAAVDRAVVKARVPGELRDLHVREGDAVVQGQVIARVDATDSEARFRQCEERESGCWLGYYRPDEDGEKTLEALARRGLV